ncbi:MAG: hypothetical protein HY272_05895 [Gammaproteobacteria bacterium]|nr:hypothetical protein [Gammaproteobacteria bacterium]
MAKANAVVPPGTQNNKERRAKSLPISIRLAQNYDELKSAYALVYTQYLKQGYQKPSSKGVRFLPHFGLPTSYTLIAEINGNIVGTLTIVSDGLLGLPMEKEYPEAVTALRVQERRMAEISCLATRRGRDLPVILQLMYAIYEFSFVQLGMTDLCVAVTTEHQPFYRKVLRFEAISDPTPYSSCNDIPAIAMKLDLTRAREKFNLAHNISRMVGRFFLYKAQSLKPNLALPAPEHLAARHRFAEDYVEWPELDTDVRKKVESAYRQVYTNKAT